MKAVFQTLIFVIFLGSISCGSSSSPRFLGSRCKPDHNPIPSQPKSLKDKQLKNGFNDLPSFEYEHNTTEVFFVAPHSEDSTDKVMIHIKESTNDSGTRQSEILCVRGLNPGYKDGFTANSITSLNKASGKLDFRSRTFQVFFDGNKLTQEFVSDKKTHESPKDVYNQGEVYVFKSDDKKIQIRSSIKLENEGEIRTLTLFKASAEGGVEKDPIETSSSIRSD